ncbi:uncharacterized protein METZ01_LOCUS133182, partial [marine metagenome]
MSLLSIAGATPSDDGFELKSARMHDTDYLARTPSVEGNRRTWTYSFWVKRSTIGVEDHLLFYPIAASFPYTGLLFDASTDTLVFYDYSGSYNYQMKTTQKFRDVSAWYHFVVALDMTQGTAANRIKIYLNGEQITAFATTDYGTQNFEGGVNRATAFAVGGDGASAGLHGYMAEVYFIDGVQLTPASFGATNTLTNQWQPLNPTDIKSTLTFGTNGFYLPFSNDALATTFADSAFGHPITPVNQTYIIGPKLGTSAIAFDGSGAPANGYLSMPDSADWQLGGGTGAFTVEFFMNLSGLMTGHGGSPSVMGQRSSGTSRWSIYQSRSGLSFYSANGGDGTVDMDTSDVVINQWYHIAFVRNGDVFTWYIDGVEDTSYTDAYTIPDVGALMYVGYNGDTSYGEFDGYMDEIRISNVARYTADFTPPTSEFVSDANTKLLIHSNTTMGSTTFDDSSSSDHTITAADDAMHVAPKIGAGMAAFDG